MNTWEIILALLPALGGLGFIQWLVTKNAFKRLKNAEAKTAEVGSENSIRDMYEDTIAKIKAVHEEMVEHQKDHYEARLAKAHETIDVLNNQILEAHKSGAKKDSIIDDKTAKIRQQNETILALTEENGKLKHEVEIHKMWRCVRPFNKSAQGCFNRKPTPEYPLTEYPFLESEPAEITETANNHD